MHSALLVIEKPAPFGPQHYQAWRALAGRLEEAALRRRSAVETLGEWCFLVNLSVDGGLDALGELLAVAQFERHRVLFFKKEPAWVRASGPTT